MYEGLREILLAGIANRQTIIHFPNGEHPDITEGIYSGSLKLEEILNSGEVLNFGECNASKFEVTIANIDDISDKIIYVYQKIAYDPNKVDVIIDRNQRYIVTRTGQKISVGQHEDYSIPIFYGRVDSAKLQTDRIHRDITAYDELYFKGDVNCAEWYNNIFKTTKSVKLKAFRNSLFEFIGINQEDKKLTNDTVDIAKTISTDSLKFRDVIKAICQLAGVFGHIDREGVFRYIDVSNPINTYDISDNYRSNDSTYEGYTVKAIDKLQVRTDDEDIGAIVGEGNNPYIMQGNFLIYGKTSERLAVIAGRILEKIKGVTYRPVDVSTIYSEPYISVGDMLTFTTKRDGETVNTIVLNTSLSGTQLLKQEIVAEGDEYRDEVVDDVNAEITQLLGKTLKIIKNVDEYSVKLEDLEKGSAEMKLTVDGLTTTVELHDGRISTAQQTADKIQWIIKDGTNSSDFTLTSRMAKLVAEEIDITGFVTFTELGDEASRTFINGANIMTGSITVDKIKSLEIEAEDIYLDGAAVFSFTGASVDIMTTSDFSGVPIYLGRSVVLGSLHSNSKVGFFGSTGSTIKSVTPPTSSATAANVRSSLIELINALNSYGLIEKS